MVIFDISHPVHPLNPEFRPDIIITLKSQFRPSNKANRESQKPIGNLLIFTCTVKAVYNIPV